MCGCCRRLYNRASFGCDGSWTRTASDEDDRASSSSSIEADRFGGSGGGGASNTPATVSLSLPSPAQLVTLFRRWLLDDDTPPADVSSPPTSQVTSPIRSLISAVLYAPYVMDSPPHTCAVTSEALASNQLLDDLVLMASSDQPCPGCAYDEDRSGIDYHIIQIKRAREASVTAVSDRSGPVRRRCWCAV